MVLKGKNLPRGVNLDVTPGSKQVLRAIAKNGGPGRHHRLRGRILESACGLCIGMGQAPARARLRCAPSTATSRAARAPGTPRCTWPVPGGRRGQRPDRQARRPAARWAWAPQDRHARRVRRCDDGMITPAWPRGKANAAISAAPTSRPCPSSGRPAREPGRHRILKVGDNITTDHIMPAGILPLRSNIPAISQHVFAALDPDFAARGPKPAPRTAVLRRRTTARAPPGSTRPWPRATWGCGHDRQVHSRASTRQPGQLRHSSLHLRQRGGLCPHGERSRNHHTRNKGCLGKGRRDRKSCIQGIPDRSEAQFEQPPERSF